VSTFEKGVRVKLIVSTFEKGVRVKLTMSTFENGVRANQKRICETRDLPEMLRGF
jgi:hypothetical protein